MVHPNLTLSSIVESISSLQFTIRGMILSQKLNLVFVVSQKMKSKNYYKDKKSCCTVLCPELEIIINVLQEK